MNSSKNFSVENFYIDMEEYMKILDLHKWLDHLGIVAYSLAILLHVTGFIALYLHKQQTTQKIILFNLSLVGIVLCIIGIVMRTNEVIGYLAYVTDITFDFIEFMSLVELVLTMYILTLD